MNADLDVVVQMGDVPNEAHGGGRSNGHSGVRQPANQWHRQGQDGRQRHVDHCTAEAEHSASEVDHEALRILKYW